MKSTYQIVAETAVKHRKGRKIVLWEGEFELFNKLKSAGIDAAQIIILDDENEQSLERFRNACKDYYIVIGKRERTEINRTIFEKIGFKEVIDYMFVHGIKRFITQEMHVYVKETDAMNIMGITSFGRMPYVLPQLQMLQDRHPGKLIRFYLLYHVSLVPEAEQLFRRVSRYAKYYKNIEFHGVPVGEEDDELQELLDKYIGLTRYHTFFNGAGTFYYCFMVHKYLPKNLDRILYIDIGDTVINDSLVPYYYEDFEDKLMLQTIGWETRLRDSNGKLRPFCAQDCENPTYLKMLAHESFNGGVKLYNLEKMRRLNYSIHDYIEFAKGIQDKYHLGTALFYDQGLLGMMYLGDIKFYKMKEFDDEAFMPFNFASYAFTKEDGSFIDTYYEPAIVHFCGPRSCKPFFAKYPQKLDFYQDGVSLREGNGNAENYYFQWYDAALKAEEIMKKVDREYVPENIMEICKIGTFEEYIHYLEFLAKNFLVCVSIMDTAGHGLSNHAANKLTALGLADLRQEARWSYVFAQIKGKILLNKLDGFQSVAEQRILCDGHTIEMASVAYTKGSLARILIDGKDYAVNCRGLNIVVFDLDMNRLIDTVGFDTYLKNNPCYRKSDLFYAINGLSSNAQVFHNIATSLSSNTYGEILKRCNEMIEKIEGNSVKEVEIGGDK